MTDGLTKMLESGGFSYDASGTGRVDVSFGGRQESIIYGMNVDGAFKMPDEEYAKFKITLAESSAPDSETGSAELEIYVKGDKVFIKDENGSWELAEEDPELLNLEQYDPRHLIRMLFESGMQVTPVREIRDGGKDYLLVSGKIEGENLYKYMVDNGLLENLLEEEMPAQIKEGLIKGLKNIQSTFEYWVDTDSRVLSKFRGIISGSLKVPVPDAGNDLLISVNFSLEGKYKTGVPLQMPVVTKQN